MKKQWFVALALASGLAAQPWQASACGGCFAPPNTAQVVTDHRMVLSLSTTQTTLWDQFKFGGSPTDFSWILPIHYDPSVSIHIADDRFMTVVDDISTPVLLPPPAPPSSNCGAGAARDASYAASDAGYYDVHVDVYREEAVGPYEVAIIGSSDPTSITLWLQRNGYGVPNAVIPVIQYYTGQHMDFVALKLRPAEGVSRIAPVRITFPGYQPVLPLRMIAAGTSDRVGLVLAVIAAARIEAQNFPNGEITDDALVYDYARPTSQSADLNNAFEALNAASGQRLWLTESSLDQPRSFLDALAQQAIQRSPVDGGTSCVDAGGDDAGSAMSSMCTAADALDDVATAFAGLDTTARITRLRADLSAAALDRDLLLQAGTLETRDRFYRYGHLLNMPTEAAACDGGAVIDVYTPPSQSVDAGRAVDAAHAADAGDPSQVVGGCSAGRTGSSGRTGFGFSALALAATWAVRRRGRRARNA